MTIEIVPIDALWIAILWSIGHAVGTFIAAFISVWWKSRNDETKVITLEYLREVTQDAYKRGFDASSKADALIVNTQEEIHGNSPEHWYAKATAYKGIVFEVCQAFRSLGYEGEFDNLDTLAERLDAHAKSILSALPSTREGS